MAEERLQRRLAAILSADVVGYSHLMGLDEAGTLGRLTALRRDLIEPTIATNAGRIVKLMGDGILVEFGSVVDAVTCAIEIQNQVPDHDSNRPDTTPIQLRIGINVGDIIIEGDDIFGDGVNIAARLEGIAPPGGISLSEDAWRQVQGKVAAHFVDSGEHSLKNIARPVRVYCVEFAGKNATRQTALPSVASLSRFIPYVTVPVILLLLAHYLIIVTLDADPIFLRGVAVVVPFTCGYLLFRTLRTGMVGAILLGLAIALPAVFGMTTVVGLVDSHSILPASKAEWQEVFEYLVTVTLATAAGNGLARIMSAAMLEKSGAS